MSEYEVFKVDKKNIAAFMYLLPKKYDALLGNKGQYVLGCVDENSSPVGVLCFFKQRDNINIRYICVKKEERRKGIASRMMRELYAIAQKSKISSVEIAIPHSNSSDETEHDLIGLVDDFTGYVPEWSRDFITSVGELKKVSLDRYGFNWNVKALKEVPEEQFSKFIKKIPYSLKKGRNFELTTKASEYDADVSAVLYKGNSICGVLLVNAFSDFAIIPSLLYVNNNDMTHGLLGLCIWMMEAIVHKYKDDDFVYFGCFEERYAKLYAGLLSGIEGIPVFRYRLDV